MRKVNILCFFICLILSGRTMATHIRAGEIQVKTIDCENHVYKIIISGYTDTGSSVQFGNGKLQFGDGTGIEFIEGSHAFKEKKDLGNELALNIFEVEHTYPGPGKYSISFYERNRNADINNFENSVNTPFYIETEFTINPYLGCNSTPDLHLPPVDYAAVGAIFTYNPGAVDPDGDSLSYKLAIPKRNPEMTVEQYRYPNDPQFEGTMDGSSAQATFAIDNNGTIKWNTPGMNGEYGLAFVIEEWREISQGQWRKIASTTRDMQVIVDGSDLSCPEVHVKPDTTVEQGTIIMEIKADQPESDYFTITAASPLLENPAFNAKLDYDPETGQGTFSVDLSCRNLKNKTYPVVFRVEGHSPYGNLATYTTSNITVGNDRYGHLDLYFQEETIVISWEAVSEEKYTNLQLSKLHTKTYNNPLICDNSPGENSSVLAELDIDETTWSDALSDLENDFAGEYCYSLSARDTNGVENILYQKCISNPWAQIPEIEEKDEPILIYPNPVEDYLFVAFPEIQGYVELKVVNTSGQLVKNLRFNNAKTIYLPFQDANAGLYFFYLKGNDQTVKRTLVKY